MNIALIGYGKMGHEIEKIAISRGHNIVSIIDVNNSEDFDSDAFKSADVAIEFSTPKSAIDNYRKSFAANVPVVAGTTGWLDHLDEVKKACSENGKTFFYAPEGKITSFSETDNGRSVKKAKDAEKPLGEWNTVDPDRLVRSVDE